MLEIEYIRSHSLKEVIAKAKENILMLSRTDKILIVQKAKESNGYKGLSQEDQEMVFCFNIDRE